MLDLNVSRGRARDWLIRAAASIATISLIYSLTPHVGFIHDGQRYAEIASDPFGNSIGSPWSLRIGIPLLVAISPFSQATSFYAISALSALVASLFVAATVTALGLPERHARASTVLTSASQLTIICFWSYYIDLSVLALYAAVVYFGLIGRHWLVVPLVAVFTPVKEIAILAGPLASLLGGRRRRAWLWGVAATFAGLAVYAALNLALDTAGAASGITPNPTSGSVLQTQWDYSVAWVTQIWRYGLVRYSGNAVLSVFGVMWLFWIVGYRRAPATLRRAVWWVALTLPVLMTAQWERSLALYLPILVPLALMAIPRWRWPELSLLVAGSAWISGVAPTQTIGDDAVTRAVTKLSWMSPGAFLVVFGFALVVVRGRRDSGDPSLRAEPGPESREIAV